MAQRDDYFHAGEELLTAGDLLLGGELCVAKRGLVRHARSSENPRRTVANNSKLGGLNQRFPNARGVSGPSPAAALASQEAFDLVRRSVNDLPPLLKTVVTLYHLDDMSVAEIGKVTALPEGTSKSHRFRARQMLKDRLLRKLGKENVP
ncbi:MAG: sigma-70 family RNA polymerase sigma factor [Verrucomicrobiae bacterium]|nr:sigma-70 family RNA polymerase sigma factor [Verrucomicrobiae bacterium]